ncbi:hypothetical protein [Egbenema bharatensis]|uniref:hypothetical protein n=1 Tax=Egbenema bharatensis TaxID=3463334 RepID=UPI003A89F4F7
MLDRPLSHAMILRLLTLPPILMTTIKRISIVLITGAILLELWHLYAGFTLRSIPAFLAPLLWIGRFALIAHLIEGIIAAIYAPGKQKSPLLYGTYTFFVGTIGLVELFALNSAEMEPDQQSVE